LILSGGASPPWPRDGYGSAQDH